MMASAHAAVPLLLVSCLLLLSGVCAALPRIDGGSTTGADYFARSIALDRHLVVGAESSAYFFSRAGNEWVLEPSTPPMYARHAHGYRVATAGEWAVVSDPVQDGASPYVRDPGSNTQAGVAWVYQRKLLAGSYQWVERQSLRLPNATMTEYDRFGTGLAMSEKYLMVGAPSVTMSPYERADPIFYRLQNDKWLPDGPMIPRFPASGIGCSSNLGEVLAISGDLALASATTCISMDTGGDAGVLLWYRRVDDRWERQGAVEALLEVDSRFSHAIALQGNLALVSAIGNDLVDNSSLSTYSVPGYAPGTLDVMHPVHLLEYDNITNRWSVLHQFESPSPEPMQFGRSVAIQDDLVLISGRGIAGHDATLKFGHVYVYQQDGLVTDWKLVKEITPSPRQHTYAFGHSLVMTRNDTQPVAVIAAPVVRSGTNEVVPRPGYAVSWTLCEPGFYSSDMTCLPCPAGTVGDITVEDVDGMAACRPCGFGQYSETGSTMCLSCPLLQVSSAGASQCIDLVPLLGALGAVLLVGGGIAGLIVKSRAKKHALETSAVGKPAAAPASARVPTSKSGPGKPMKTSRSAKTASFATYPTAAAAHAAPAPAATSPAATSPAAASNRALAAPPKADNVVMDMTVYQAGKELQYQLEVPKKLGLAGLRRTLNWITRKPETSVLTLSWLRYLAPQPVWIIQEAVISDSVDEAGEEETSVDFVQISREETWKQLLHRKSADPLRVVAHETSSDFLVLGTCFVSVYDIVTDLLLALQLLLLRQSSKTLAESARSDEAQEEMQLLADRLLLPALLAMGSVVVSVVVGLLTSLRVLHTSIREDPAFANSISRSRFLTPIVVLLSMLNLENMNLYTADLPALGISVQMTAETRSRILNAGWLSWGLEDSVQLGVNLWVVQIVNSSTSRLLLGSTQAYSLAGTLFMLIIGGLMRYRKARVIKQERGAADMLKARQRRTGDDDSAVDAVSLHTGDDDAGPVPVHSGDDDAGTVPVHSGDDDAGPVPVHSGDDDAGTVPVHTLDDNAGPVPVYTGDDNTGTVPVTAPADPSEQHVPVRPGDGNAASMPAEDAGPASAPVQDVPAGGDDVGDTVLAKQAVAPGGDDVAPGTAEHGDVPAVTQAEAVAGEAASGSNELRRRSSSLRRRRRRSSSSASKTS